MNITIKVKFKNVELEMTPAEAKELVEVLKGITGGETVKYYPWYPITYYPYRWESPTWTTTWTTDMGNTVYNVCSKE